MAMNFQPIFEKALLWGNFITLGITILITGVLGISILFGIQSNAFDVAFKAGMFIFLPVFVIFHIASVAHLFGGVKQYWQKLYPVSFGLVHWGIFTLGSSKENVLMMLLAIVAVSAVFSILVIIKKMYFSKVFLISTLVIYWLSGVVPVEVVHQISPSLKLFIATALMLISIGSAVQSKSKSNQVL